MSRSDARPLEGKRILLVEDEFLISAMAEDILTELGATVVGPAATVAKALEFASAEALDCAVLDVNLRGTMVDGVADALRERRIPFVLATGYGEAALLRSHRGPTVTKPYTKKMLADALARALECSAGSAPDSP